MEKENSSDAKKIEWYQIPVLEKDLNNLTVKSDLNGMIQTSLHIILLIITGTFTYQYLIIGDWFLSMLFLWWHGMFYSFLGWAGAGHELLHYTVFKSKLLNRFFLKLFSFLMWNNYVFFRASHMRHHDFTLYTKYDQEVKPSQKLEFASWPWLLTFNLPLFYRTLRTTIENSFGIIRGEWGKILFSDENIKERKKVVSWARFLLFGHIVLIIMFITTGQWPLVFIITIAPFFANWLNRMLALSQHFGMKANIPDFRKNSRNVILNPFLSFLYWQMNYHIEHHMYPNVPFYNLKKMNEIIKGDLPSPTEGFIALMQKMIYLDKNRKY